MTRSTQTTSTYATGLLLGGLVALVPTLACSTLIAVTGFLSNPWMDVFRISSAASLLGALTGVIIYRFRPSLALVGFIAVLAPLTGLLFGPVTSVYVEQFLAQWNTVHVYDSFGSAQLILPPGWSWGYTAILWACVVIWCGTVAALLLVAYMLWERYHHAPAT